MNKPPQLERVEWLAARLNMRRDKVYAAIADGSIPRQCVHKIGRRLRIKPDVVEAWIDGSLPVELEKDACPP